MEIFANHAHVIPGETMKNAGISDLARLMEECGISRSVTFAPFPNKCPNENSNTWLYGQIKNDNRFVGFGVLDFDKDNIRDQVYQIKDYGFSGIKMHPAYQKFPIMCEKATQAYAAAEELGLVISFHTGVHNHRILDNDVKLFDEVAYNFKKLRFTMEHIGGYAFFYDAIGVLGNNRNVYAGFTSIFDYDSPRWYLTEQQLHDTIRMIGANRCAFGLDFPYNKAPLIQKGIDTIMNLNITEAEKEMILGGTLKALLNIQ